MQVDWRDIQHLASLYMEESDNALSPSGHSVWYGALEGGEYVAFAHSFWRSERVVSLNACFVLPEHRRKGHYRELLDERLRDARDAEATKVICGYDEEWMGPYLTGMGFELVEYQPGKHFVELRMY